jgi:hypothetical protein
LLKGYSDEVILSCFRWFGSYLVWWDDTDNSSFRGCSNGAKGPAKVAKANSHRIYTEDMTRPPNIRVFVSHLRGRKLNPKQVAYWRNDPSLRLLRKVDEVCIKNQDEEERRYEQDEAVSTDES